MEIYHLIGINLRRPFDEENLKIKYYEGKLKILYTSYLFENIRSLNRFELFISVFQSLFRNYFSKKVLMM